MVLDPTAWALVGSSLVSGVVSALTPVVPTEAVVLSIAATHPGCTSVAVAVAAALGQTAGKVILMLVARGATGTWRWLPRQLRRHADQEAQRADTVMSEASGASRLSTLARASRPSLPTSHTRGSSEPRGRRAVLRRTATRLTRAGVRWLDSRWAPAVVVVSGAVGLPPLMLMAVAAGLSRMSVSTFALACFVGRAVRFLVLAWVPGLVLIGG